MNREDWPDYNPDSLSVTTVFEPGKRHHKTVTIRYKDSKLVVAKLYDDYAGMAPLIMHGIRLLEAIEFVLLNDNLSAPNTLEISEEERSQLKKTAKPNGLLRAYYYAIGKHLGCN